LSWVPQTSGVSTWLQSVYFIDANTGYAVGGESTNGKIIKTVNGGTLWTLQSIPTNYAMNSVYFANASTGVAVGNSGKILKTINGGTNWIEQASGTVLYSVNITPKGTTNSGYTVGWNGLIKKSTDGGTTWTNQTSGTTKTLNSVYFIEQGLTETGYIVGESGTILKTTNGGGVGIKENTIEKQISIFPNPASDMVTFNIDNRNNENLTLSVYNVMGALVRSEKLKQNQHQLNVGDLDNGVYMVEIKSKGWIGYQKLIIQR
jgi:photosystem II stability/assembly factor-like uncharacterized protein